MLKALYGGRSRLVVLPIQDLFVWSARINRPGIVGDRNWTWRLPLPLEQLKRNPWVRQRIARMKAIAGASGRFGA